VLELDGLTHEYGDARALDSISLTIPDGQFLVLCGANGSGKTTLVRHLNALETADSGAVLVNGEPAAENPVVARTTVGMTFQDPRDQFVAATVGADVAFGPENLGLAHEEIDERVAEALAAVGLDGRESDRIETLSGGEQQRLAIAGALAMRPDYLVLDEPFTGLDAPAREAVLARLEALHRDGTGIIVVTHDLRELLHPADRVVCLANGRVVVDDSPESAMAALEQYGVRVPNSAG